MDKYKKTHIGGFTFLGSEMNLYSWAIGWLTGLLTWTHNVMVLENTQFEFSCSTIIEHCHLVQNFPPVPEIISQTQSDPSPFFSKGLGKYAIWVILAKLLNIAIWLKISPGCQICYRKFHPPFSIGLQRFLFKKGLADFQKKMFPDFKSSFSIYSYTVLTSILDPFPTVHDPYCASLYSVRWYVVRKYTIWVYIKILFPPLLVTKKGKA